MSVSDVRVTVSVSDVSVTVSVSGFASLLGGSSKNIKSVTLCAFVLVKKRKFLETGSVPHIRQCASHQADDTCRFVPIIGYHMGIILDGNRDVNPFQSNFSATRILPSCYLFWAGKRLVNYF
jgi:hypothetical protein